MHNLMLLSTLTAALLTALLQPAQAQATRTWVSGVGDDANPCSRTAPCKTFAGAISKTATNGEIDVLDPGGFGIINITKSMTLDGTTGAGFGSILATGSPYGVLINIPPGNVNDPLRTVRLRNLYINGTGGGTRSGTNGIRILAADTVYIENVVISDFTSRGISDERSTAGRLFVTDTIVRNNGAAGIGVVGAAQVQAMFDRVVAEANVGAGFAIGNGAKATARNATAAGNAIGFYADTAGTEFNLKGCVSHANGTGIQAGTPGTPIIRLSDCMITNNTSNGFVIAAGSILSFQNNDLAGNGGTQTGLGAANPARQ